MASDNLNQIGRTIGKTRKDADRALKRVSPIRPRLERIRDVFDKDIEFEMSFIREEQDKRVMLDLFFNLPPPVRGCQVDCIHTTCEEFDFETGGNHAVTVKNPYIPGTVSVYINGDKLPDSSVNEVSPTSGEVFFQGTAGPDVVGICYIYETCNENALCPTLTPTHAGWELVFSDNFNRMPSVIPYGGRGYWYKSSPSAFSGIISDITTPVIPKNWLSGALQPTVSTLETASYVFQDMHAAGPLFEVIMSCKFFKLYYTPSLQGLYPDQNNFGNPRPYQPANAPEPSLLITDFGNFARITMTAPYIYYADTDPTFTSPLAGTYSQTYSVPITLSDDNGDGLPVFVRYMYDGVYSVKIWRQIDPEPAEWVFLTGVPTTDATHLNITYPEVSNFAGGNFGTGTNPTGSSGLYIMGIDHWAGNTDTFNRWNNVGEYGRTWSRSECEDASGWLTTGPPGTWFDGCIPGPQESITEGNTKNPEPPPISDWRALDTAFPSYRMRGAQSVFDTLKLYYSGFEQTVVSYETIVGKNQAARISGEVRWILNQSTTLYPAPPLTIELQDYAYGDFQPSTNGRWFTHASTRQTIVADQDVWYPFSIDVESYNTGHIQWGVVFTDPDPQTFFDTIYLLTNSGEFGLKIAPAMTQFRNIRVKTDVQPIGGAQPFCPTHDGLQDRCAPFSDGLIGPTLDYVCKTAENTNNTTSFFSTSGKEWLVSQQSNVRLEFNGSFKSIFRARGITLDGSDGRCAQTNQFQKNGATSITSTMSRIATLSPASCGNYSITLQFKFGTIGAVWASTVAGGSSNIEPDAELFISGGDFANYVGILITKNDPTFTYIETDNGLYPNPVVENVLYNFRMDIATDQKIKVWRASDPEPATWNVQGPRTFGSDSTIEIRVEYEQYRDDNFTMEVFNPMVVAI